MLLRTNRYPLHHGTLAAVRSLGRAGVEVHAILERDAVPAGRSRYLHRRHDWGPLPHQGTALTGHLEDVATRIGRPALLIPLDDAGAIYIAENAAALRSAFVFPAQSPDTPRMVADKASLMRSAERHGIATPASRTPTTDTEVGDAVAELELPLIAKWARPWRLPAGRRSTTMVTTRQQLEELLTGSREPLTQAAGPLILQRRISPEGGDWFFQGYFDASSTCLFGGTGRKHVARPVHAGHTVAGEWVLNPQLEQVAHRIVRSLGYTGLVDLDFRFDNESGTYQLLDFNPRLGAQFRIFHDRQHLDLVRALHLHQSGQHVPRPQPAPGRTLIVENQYLQHTVTSLAHPLRARRPAELAWWAADDPRPFLSMGRHTLAKALGKGVRARNALTGSGRRGRR
ncbi:ATP-grasp domain-containing protein [Spirillospora sp. NPDC047279]|uniref:carboxylate--amine ligase n=1 Tax=Spirillospora sp. NPDC047279 TaxID=3155478 RepID=UPI0033F19B78